MSAQLARDTDAANAALQDAAAGVRAFFLQAHVIADLPTRG